MRFSVILIMFLLSGIAMQVTAQEKQSVLNLAGVIRNEKDEPLPFVKVTVKKGKQGDVTNLMGMFSIVVSNTDTIYVTAEGYQRLRLVIRDTIRFNQVCVDIRMTPDSTAETLAVFPYKTYEEFKDAVLKLQLKEDADIERARKNMAMIRAQILMDNTLSPNASFKSVMQEQYDKMYYRGQFMGNPLFNLFNWAQLIKAIKEERFKDSRELKNYEIKE